MSTFTTIFLSEISDNRTGREKSANGIIREGDWSFTQLGNYTEVSPLVVSAGNTAKITFTPSDVSFSTGNGFTASYDFINQKFTPTTVGDVFMVEIRMKIKCSLQNGHGDLMIESPTFAFNPIQGQSINIPKAANTQQFISVNVPLFIGQEIKDNGLEVKWHSVSGNFSLYDISYMIVRLASGI